MKELTPRVIVNELNKYIIGQDEAKKAVAVALRNRYRRSLLDNEMKAEITPKNILMIGPTGVGKTEIARRLAKLVQAPFVKVEATKFTEVGYVGRDVESIIRDLLEASIRIVKKERILTVDAKAKESAINIIVDTLITPNKTKNKMQSLEMFFEALDEMENKTKIEDDEKEQEIAESESLKVVDEEKLQRDREELRNKILEGKLDDETVSIEIEDMSSPDIEVLAGSIGADISDMFSGIMPKKVKKRKVKMQDAIKILTAQEAQKFIDLDSVYEEAIKRAEETGIVFIDEIDKIASNSSRGAEVSREGVQRDILPIIEGSTIVTKYGSIKTDFILFIGAGAFHVSKVSDLIPELQGRFPIRVDLKPLTKQNFKEILTKPNNALTKQYKALLSTEKINIEFEDEAIEILSEIAVTLNEQNENIGARRLFTIMEDLFQDLFFETEGEALNIKVDKDFISKNITKKAFNKDLNKYII